MTNGRHPALHLDSSGKVRVGKADIPLDDILDAHQKGVKGEQLLARFRNLSGEELQAALDYHLEQEAGAVAHLPEQRDAHWQKWNATLADDLGTDTPPNAPIQVPQ